MEKKAQVMLQKLNYIILKLGKVHDRLAECAEELEETILKINNEDGE